MGSSEDDRPWRSTHDGRHRRDRGRDRRDRDRERGRELSSEGRRRPLHDYRRQDAGRDRSYERREDRGKKYQRSRSSSYLSNSSRYRSRQKRRRSYDYDSSADERSRRRYHKRPRDVDRDGRSLSPARRGDMSRSPRRHHRRERDDTHDYRRRRRSPGSYSPDRRRRDQRRHRRRRRGDRGSLSVDSPRLPPVAADAPPRAGVVSDDDDVAPTAPNVPLTNENKQQASSKKRESVSSSHDDTVGHFKGREGTVIDDRYRIVREVGVGTFGRVVECLDLRHARSKGNRWDRQGNIVAIKIVRNIKRYHESAKIEADIVEDVNKRGGRGVSHCAIMFDTFSFSGHYCMVFEKLGPSLYDFLKSHKYRPFPMMCVRDFTKQLLETIEFLHSFGLIHTDLKPENILLLNDREVNYKGNEIPECTRIKVIDFGGATYDKDKKSSVVNTRQYRAPEVILEVGWSMPSDIWSVGCILAELYQGELLFPTHGNIEHLALIERIIGPFPKRLLKRAKNRSLVEEAFDANGNHRMERVLVPEKLAYVKRMDPLENIIYEEDAWFLRLLKRILVTDPDQRATARECLRKF